MSAIMCWECSSQPIHTLRCVDLISEQVHGVAARVPLTPASVWQVIIAYVEGASKM